MSAEAAKFRQHNVYRDWEFEKADEGLPSSEIYVAATSDDDLSDSGRERKRQRIEEHGYNYIRGRPIYITCAQIPYGQSWNEQWVDLREAVFPSEDKDVTVPSIVVNKKKRAKRKQDKRTEDKAPQATVTCVSPIGSPTRSGPAEDPLTPLLQANPYRRLVKDRTIGWIKAQGDIDTPESTGDESVAPVNTTPSKSPRIRLPPDAHPALSRSPKGRTKPPKGIAPIRTKLARSKRATKPLILEKLDPSSNRVENGTANVHQRTTTEEISVSPTPRLLPSHYLQAISSQSEDSGHVVQTANVLQDKISNMNLPIRSSQNETQETPKVTTLSIVHLSQTSIRNESSKRNVLQPNPPSVQHVHPVSTFMAVNHRQNLNTDTSPTKGTNADPSMAGYISQAVASCGSAVPKCKVRRRGGRIKPPAKVDINKSAKSAPVAIQTAHSPKVKRPIDRLRQLKHPLNASPMPGRESPGFAYRRASIQDEQINDRGSSDEDRAVQKCTPPASPKNENLRKSDRSEIRRIKTPHYMQSSPKPPKSPLFRNGDEVAANTLDSRQPSAPTSATLDHQDNQSPPAESTINVSSTDEEINRGEKPDPEPVAAESSAAEANALSRADFPSIPDHQLPQGPLESHLSTQAALLQAHQLFQDELSSPLNSPSSSRAEYSPAVDPPPITPFRDIKFKKIPSKTPDLNTQAMLDGADLRFSTIRKPRSESREVSAAYPREHASAQDKESPSSPSRLRRKTSSSQPAGVKHSDSTPTRLSGFFSFLSSAADIPSTAKKNAPPSAAAPFVSTWASTNPSGTASSLKNKVTAGTPFPNAQQALYDEAVDASADDDADAEAEAEAFLEEAAGFLS